jgi:hypothetical protein
LSYVWAIESPPYQEASVRIAQSRGSDLTWFAIGVVRYSDRIGRIRETGFLRRFDFKNRRWLREDNPDYEYSY